MQEMDFVQTVQLASNVLLVSQLLALLELTLSLVGLLVCRVHLAINARLVLLLLAQLLNTPPQQLVLHAQQEVIAKMETYLSVLKELIQEAQDLLPAYHAQLDHIAQAEL